MKRIRFNWLHVLAGPLLYGVIFLFGGASLKETMSVCAGYLVGYWMCWLAVKWQE